MAAHWLLGGRRVKPVAGTCRVPGPGDWFRGALTRKTSHRATGTELSPQVSDERMPVVKMKCAVSQTACPGVGRDGHMRVEPACVSLGLRSARDGQSPRGSTATSLEAVSRVPRSSLGHDSSGVSIKMLPLGLRSSRVR